MTERLSTELWLTAAECARRTGVTVRALRLYEARGLIAPRRTEKRWRLYGAQEIGRLHSLVALKRLGLSLARIAELFGRGAITLDAVLAAQQDALQRLKQRTEQSLRGVRAAQAKLASGGALSIDELTVLIREMEMTDSTTDRFAQRRWEQARPRTEIRLDPAVYQRYVGAYRFETGSVITVTRVGDRLYVQLGGQPAIEIFPEAEDAYFLKVTPAQILFTPAGQGPATALALHQGGHELAAIRITDEEARAAADRLADRIARNEAAPGGETALHRALETLSKGEPAFAEMTEPLATLVREQLPLVRAEFERLGERQSIVFQRVSSGGWDVYRVRFAQGEQEWRIQLTSDGRIGGLLRARPLP